MHCKKPLVSLAPTARWEPNQQCTSKFSSLTWDLLPSMVLHAIPPVSAMRKCIQALCHLDAELYFAANFCLLSPPASSQPLWLLDYRWKLATTIQVEIVKSSV